MARAQRSAVRACMACPCARASRARAAIGSSVGPPGRGSPARAARSRRHAPHPRNGAACRRTERPRTPTQTPPRRRPPPPRRRPHRLRRAARAAAAAWAARPWRQAGKKSSTARSCNETWAG
eukprot:6729335-Prymnesium_polylepis.1